MEKYLTTRKVGFSKVGKNLMMPCPFHKDSNPSFGIRVDTGVYKCFSGSCKAQGNIAGFVQKIEGLPSYESAVEWLTRRYGVRSDEVCSNLDLIFGDEKKITRTVYIEELELKKYDFRHPYLNTRGIQDLWQSRFRVGFDREKLAITLPWFDRHERCIGIKKRSVVDKFFWWENESDVGPNKVSLFGINHVVRRKERIIVLVESEIDAIYCWQCGFPALAIGTSSITDQQLIELKNTYAETLIIATDNDAAGTKVAAELYRKIDWITDIRQVNWQLHKNAKDLNDLKPQEIKNLMEQASWKLIN